MKTAQQRVAERNVPADSKELKGENCVVYLFDYNDKPCAKGYVGTSGKPAFQYRFSNNERRLEYINEWRNRVGNWEAKKAERVAARKSFKHVISVGDILYSSWGYEQTNIDWYQVIATTDKTITVRQIAGDRNETGWLQGETRPVRDHFIEEPLTRKVSESNSIRIESFAHAWLWDGRTKHYTAYA
jgi:hypothetical protein